MYIDNLANVNSEIGKRRPIILDVCCGGGGAGVGYYRAGWSVVGCDIERQLNYPLCFIKREGIEFIRKLGYRFDAIHVSPPCQLYSVTKGLCKPGYVKLIDEFKEILEEIGKPWVIENVPGSGLSGIMLCGSMFGLKLKRHRYFESNKLLLQPAHVNNCEDREFITVCGHISSVKEAKLAMGINWNMTRQQLTQAIPPAYTKMIGLQLINYV